MLNWIKSYFKEENSAYLSPIIDTWSNRFNIVMNSEGTDMIKAYTYFILHYLLTNPNKKIVVSSPIWENCEELLIELNYRFKRILRFFPEIEITNNQSKVKGIQLSNGSEVNMYKTHRYSYINDDIDVVIFMDMGFGSPHNIETFFKLCTVVQSSKSDARFFINSAPNGHNLFYDVFRQAELKKNIFNPLRLYYWYDPAKRDTKWISDTINTIGEAEFERKYNLSFSTKKK